MGIYDREYYQEEQSGGTFSFQSIARWPLSYKMIGFYVLLFFVDHLLPAGNGAFMGAGPLTEWGLFSTSLCFSQLQVWRLVTHLFIEPDPQALLFGMVTLFFFGPMIENTLGKSKFLAYYIACGVGGAIVSALLTPMLLRAEGFQVGAFCPIMGLIVAAGIYHARRTVMFMFVIPMTMQNLAIFSVVVDLAFMVSGFRPAVGLLGSALTGFLLIRTNALSAIFDRFGGARAWRGPSVPSTIKLPNVAGVFTPKPVSEDELDRLLEKVHQHGIGSLTNAEKASLKRASKQRRQR
jgi:membrane associated rhomboid family serine protease